MMTALAAIAAIFFLGQGMKGFFARFHLPEALVFVGLGYIAGPILDMFPESDWNLFSPQLCRFSLALVVYFAALSLSLKDLIRKFLPAMALLLLGFTVAVFVGSFFGSLFQPFPTAFFASLGIAALGAGPVRSFLSGNRAGPAIEGIWAKEALWAEGLAAALGILCIAGYENDLFDPGIIFQAKAIWAGQSLLMGLGAGLVWAIFDRHFSSVSRVRFAAEAWWLLTFAAVGGLGYSGALAGLCLGLVQAQLAPGPQWLNRIFSERPVNEERVPALADAWFVLTNLFWLRLGTQLKFGNLNLLLFCFLALAMTWTARCLWMFVIANPKDYSRWEVMSLLASSPRGLAALSIGGIFVAFPNSAAGWVGSAIALVVFFSLVFSTAFLALVSVPGVRVWAHRILGRYKEDFGMTEMKVALAQGETLASEEVTLAPAVEVIMSESIPIATPIFQEFTRSPPPPSDVGAEEVAEDRKEPTMAEDVDIASIEDPPHKRRKAG